MHRHTHTYAAFTCYRMRCDNDHGFSNSFLEWCACRFARITERDSNGKVLVPMIFRDRLKTSTNYFKRWFVSRPIHTSSCHWPFVSCHPGLVEGTVQRILGRGISMVGGINSVGRTFERDVIIVCAFCLLFLTNTDVLQGTASRNPGGESRNRCDGSE